MVNFDQMCIQRSSEPRVNIVCLARGETLDALRMLLALITRHQDVPGAAHGPAVPALERRIRVQIRRHGLGSGQASASTCSFPVT